MIILQAFNSEIAFFYLWHSLFIHLIPLNFGAVKGDGLIFSNFRKSQFTMHFTENPEHVMLGTDLTPKRIFS